MTGAVASYSLTYEIDPAVPQVTDGYHELSHSLVLEGYTRFR